MPRVHPLCSLLLLFATLVAPLGCEASSSTPRVDVRDGRIRFVDGDGDVVEAKALTGLVLTVLDPNDRATRVRIDSQIDDRGIAGDPLTLYEASRWDEREDHWVPYCKPGPDGRALAMALPGRWRAGGASFSEELDDLTFTCTAGANGKCASMGFVPGLSTADGESLTPYFEACVRMMRADYCGDGRSFTVEGVPVELLDRAGRQPMWGERDLRFEAAWGANGAVCVHHPRVGGVDVDGLRRECPRLSDAVGSGCSENALFSEPGVLLINRSLAPG